MTKINGQAIRDLRKERGMTPFDLAEGICPALMLHQIERGEALPSDAVVQKIADKLGVPVAALQGE
jgi:transcriptional regulator with XRE-family HTH domain